MATKANRLQPSRLTAALLAAFVMPVTGAAFAQDANAQQDQTQTQAPANKAATLDKVVVTGSLIPQTTLETFKPVTGISAEDLKNRGYNTFDDFLGALKSRKRKQLRKERAKAQAAVRRIKKIRISFPCAIRTCNDPRR